MLDRSGKDRERHSVPRLTFRPKSCPEGITTVRISVSPLTSADTVYPQMPGQNLGRISLVEPQLWMMSPPQPKQVYTVECVHHAI